MIDVLQSRWCRWPAIAILVIGIPWAAWQRWQISHQGQQPSQTVAEKPTPRRSASEVITRIERAFSSNERHELAQLAASRLLRDRSDAELEEMLAGLKKRKFGERDYDIALAMLRELATGDVEAALDLGIAIDKQYVNDLMNGYNVRDPEGARRWLERAGELDSFGYALRRAEIISERLSDPLAALERVFEEERGSQAYEQWEIYAHNVGEEHWEPFLSFASRHKETQTIYVRRVVAKSMIARLGFDGAWEAMEEFGLPGDAEEVFAEVLATVELSNEIPIRMERLLELLPEERHLRTIHKVAADWVDIDDAATRQWLLGMPKEVRKGLKRYTAPYSIGLWEEDVK